MLKRRTTVQDDLMARAAAPPQQRLGPRRARRRRLINPALVGRGFGLLLLLLLAVVFGLPLAVNAGRFRPVLESALRGSLGRPTRIHDLRYSLRARGLVATDLAIDEDPAFGREPVLLAKTVTFDVGLLSLFFSPTPEVAGITFEDADISLKQDATGNWNYYGMLGAADRAPAAIHPVRIRLVRTRVRVAGPREGLSPLVLRDVALQLSNPSLERASRLSLTAKFEGGGTLNLDGTAGPLGWNHALPALPASLLVNIKKLNLESAKLVESVPALAGIASADFTIESDGATMQAAGHLKAEKVRLAGNALTAAEPVQAEFTVRHDLAAHSGTLSRGDLSIGKGFAGVTGAYSAPPAGPIELHLAVAANAASVSELANLLPASGFPLPSGTSLQGGLVFATLKLEGPADRPVLAGTLGIQNTHLGGFDLADKLGAIDAFNLHDLGRDVDLTAWSANIRLAPEAAALDNIRATVSSFGEIAGAGTIAAGGSLDLRMTGTRPGAAPVPFAIRGTCSDPVFRPVAR